MPADWDAAEKESRKCTKVQEFMYRDITNLELEMCDYTCKDGVPDTNKMFTEKVRNRINKSHDRFSKNAVLLGTL